MNQHNRTVMEMENTATRRPTLTGARQRARHLVRGDLGHPTLKAEVRWLPLTAGIVAAGILVSCGIKTEVTVPLPTSATNEPAMGSPARPEFVKLVGRWQRPDGGYVLEIRGADSSGKLDAAYFNPNPIHVSRAVTIRAAEETKVFVELRDENYPGCTYSLKYDPQADQLFGQYFQAAINETYDVAFERMK